MRKPFTLMQCLNWCVKSAITSSKTVPHFTVKAWDHFGVTPQTHKKMKNYKELATFNHVFLVGLDTILMTLRPQLMINKFILHVK